MTVVYKLTDRDNRTYGGYEWPPGEWQQTNGHGDLCGPGWLHGYDHPLLAVLHNPIHGDYTDYLLWEGEGDGRRWDDHGLKCGYTRMRVLQQIPVPQITTQQRVRYAIGIALTVYPDPAYRTWALDWLTGQDTTAGVAEAVAARAAAAWAARAAAEAARAAEAWAARAAAEAVHAVASADGIDLVAIAEWAVTGSNTPPFWAAAQ